jgi:ATP-dependent Zn protease
MTHVKFLAASPRALVEVLVDELRRRNKQSRGGLAASAGADRHDRQLSMSLDEVESNDAVEAIPMLRPDDVAAAVLLGTAFEKHRAGLARLQDMDAITVIEVATAELVNPIARLLRTCVLGSTATVRDGDGLGKEITPAGEGTVAIFKRGDDDKLTRTSEDNADFAIAVQRCCAVIGIAADPDHQLPRDLVRLAEHRIVVPPLDAPAIATVIEAVTGRHPGALDDEFVRHVTLETLTIAVRADLGAARSIARLYRLLEGPEQSPSAGPLLSEMHGLGLAKQWGLDLVADLRAYAAGKLPWDECPKGLLLTGSPGVGKTSFARALAREAGVHFIATSYAAWQSHREGHLGHVTAAIRRTFAEAASNQPCIVFIDEIDSLQARGGGGSGSGGRVSGGRNDDWWTAIVNVVLEQLDGFERREGLVVIAACNDPSNLDPALVRAGRLDRRIAIPLPDVPALIGIFRMHLGTDLEGADLRPAALAARGRTGADVERYTREARRVARTAGRALEMQDLLNAVRGGERELPAPLRHLVSYHEAGHAIALIALGVAEPKALSIGGTGGFTDSDLGEIQALTRVHLEKVLVALLAGRAAEQIIFGEGSAGAGGDDSDLSRATQLAMRLETSYGLGSLGLLCISGIDNRDILLLEKLRSAVTGTIDRAYAAALDLLGENRSALDALAAALFAAGYLDHAEIDAALAQTPLRAKMTTDARTVQDSQKPGIELGEIDAAVPEYSGHVTTVEA